MADKSLVQGAAVLGATKGPVGADMNLGFKGVDNTQLLAAKKANEQKVAETTAAINSHMARLSSNVDLTGYTNEEQKAFKNFLNAQRSAYAYAANEAARIGDASDPDYQFYVDSMNAINNSIVNLKTQSTAYQEGKINFAETNEADMWSAGNDPESNGNAQLIFGLGETRAPMKIDNNGNLGFEINGNTIMYKDYESPFMKDYQTAKYIADTSNTLYNSRSKLSDAKRHQIRLGLEQQLAKPESLKSIISADFTLDGLDFSNIVFNPEDIAGTRKQLIDAIMQGYVDVATAGYNEKNNGNKDSPSINPGNISNNDVYNNTGGAFKTLGELDKGYMAMTDIQNQFLSLPSDAPRDGLNTFVNVSPNVAFRYMPPQMIDPMVKDPKSGKWVPEMVEDPKSGKMVPKKASYEQGYWVKMVRSGQAGTFKPAKLPDGSAEMFTDLRDWYLAASGQKK